MRWLAFAVFILVSASSPALHAQGKLGPVEDLKLSPYDLDRIVTGAGQSTASSAHPLLEPGQGPDLRDGASDPNMAGPLGLSLIQRLTDPTLGIVLDSWIDADGVLRGDAGSVIQNP